MSVGDPVYNPEIEVLVFHGDELIASKKMHRFPITVGRAKDSSFVVDSPYFSRKHFELNLEGNKVILKDLQSRNGIRIDGRLVSTIQFEDKLSFTIKKLRVQIQVLATSVDRLATVIHMAPPPKPTARPPKDNVLPVLEKTPAAVKPASPVAEETVKQNFSAHRTPLTSKASGVASSGQNIAKVSLKPGPGAPQKIKHHSRSPVIEQEMHSQYMQIHTKALTAKSRKLEAVLMWKSQIYGVHEFFQNDKMTIGSHEMASLRVPSIPKGWSLGRMNFTETRCLIPHDRKATLLRDGKSVDVSTLGIDKILPHKSGRVVKVAPADVLHIDLGSEMTLILRYVPTPEFLPRKEMLEPDWALKRYFAVSAIIHTAIAMTLWFIAPAGKNIPKLENVPERYARLLVDPPPVVMPVPPPPPPPPVVEKKPEPPTKMEIVKKPTPEIPKIVRKMPKPVPKKIALHKPIERQLQKYQAPKNNPPQVAVSERPVKDAAGAKEPPKVEAPAPNLGAMGALGALGALSAVNNEPSAKPIAIVKGGRDIASGGSGPAMPNMPQISGGGGALIAGGTGAMKTKPGTGSGEDYGTVGLKSKAGSRSVAGAVVGVPKLESSTKSEGLTRKQVMDEVQKHLPEVQTCYERSLLSNPDLSGRMEFEWDIEASGNVSEARVKRSTVKGGDALSDCVKGIFRKMKFPTAKNGQSTTPNIGFPFGRM